MYSYSSLLFLYFNYSNYSFSDELFQNAAIYWYYPGFLQYLQLSSLFSSAPASALQHAANQAHMSRRKSIDDTR